MKKRLGHEIKTFIFVRFLTILFDFLAYRAFLWFDVFDRFSPTINIDISKMLGFILGTLFAYFANKYWTFGHQEQTQGTNSSPLSVLVLARPLSFATHLRSH